MVQPRVLDTSAILSGAPLEVFTGDGDRPLLAPVELLDELTPGGPDRRRLDYLLGVGLTLRESSPEAVARVAQAAGRTGDAPRLARVDARVLAVALDVNGEVVSDDYRVQNVARALRLRFMGLARPGTKATWRWGARCVGCRRTFDDAPGVCPVCGSDVRLVRR